MHKKRNLSIEEQLSASFKVFDRDHNGYISLNELKKLLQDIGENVSDTELQEMVKEVDADSDGKISFEGIYSFFALTKAL
jgi:Ca2+-binding EF-hand superfamily protein